MVLPEQRCQKCAKLGRHFGAAGTALPKMRQVGRKLPNLQQVWFKYAKLAVSMTVQAILGAIPAALAVLAFPTIPAALQKNECVVDFGNE